MLGQAPAFRLLASLRGAVGGSAHGGRAGQAVVSVAVLDARAASALPARSGQPRGRWRMRHPPRLQRPTCAQGTAAGAVEAARRERQVAASQCPLELESLGSFAPLPSRHCFSASRLQQPQRPQRGSARGPALLKSFAAAGSSPPVRQELFLELRAASVRPSNHRCRLLGSAGAPERLPSRPPRRFECIAEEGRGKLAALASPCAVEALERRSAAATMRAWAPAARSPPPCPAPVTGTRASQLISQGCAVSRRWSPSACVRVTFESH